MVFMHLAKIRKKLTPHVKKVRENNENQNDRKICEERTPENRNDFHCSHELDELSLGGGRVSHLSQKEEIEAERSTESS